MEVEIKHYDKQAHSIIYASSCRFKGVFHSFYFGMWDATTMPILKHYGRDEMAVSLQMTFWNSFSCMQGEKFEYNLNIFPKARLKIAIIGAHIDLAPSRRQAIR